MVTVCDSSFFFLRQRPQSRERNAVTSSESSAFTGKSGAFPFLSTTLFDTFKQPKKWSTQSLFGSLSSRIVLSTGDFVSLLRSRAIWLFLRLIRFCEYLRVTSGFLESHGIQVASMQVDYLWDHFRESVVCTLKVQTTDFISLLGNYYNTIPK